MKILQNKGTSCGQTGLENQKMETREWFDLIIVFISKWGCSKCTGDSDKSLSLSSIFVRHLYGQVCLDQLHCISCLEFVKCNTMCLNYAPTLSLASPGGH